jgi:hypothetical protein
MPWFRSPVKLFAYAALCLFVVRLVFPPPDDAVQLHSYVHFLDLRLDLTGYGVFEFAALVFVVSALAYYVVSQLTHGEPSGTLVQLHFLAQLAVCGVIDLLGTSRKSDSGCGNPRPHDSSVSAQLVDRIYLGVCSVSTFPDCVCHRRSPMCLAKQKCGCLIKGRI